jgi:hypothetical protein
VIIRTVSYVSAFLPILFALLRGSRLCARRRRARARANNVNSVDLADIYWFGVTVLVITIIIVAVYKL